MFFCFFYRFSCLLTVYFFVFIHRCVILSCTCVLLVSIAVLLHVSILAVLLAFYMCPFWQSCWLFTCVHFGTIAVFLQVSLLAVSLSFNRCLFFWGSIAVFLQSFYRCPFWQYRSLFTVILQVSFLAVWLSFYMSFLLVSLSFYTCPFRK